MVGLGGVHVTERGSSSIISTSAFRQREVMQIFRACFASIQRACLCVRMHRRFGEYLAPGASYKHWQPSWFASRNTSTQQLCKPMSQAVFVTPMICVVFDVSSRCTGAAQAGGYSKPTSWEGICCHAMQASAHTDLDPQSRDP